MYTSLIIAEIEENEKKKKRKRMTNKTKAFPSPSAMGPRTRAEWNIADDDLDTAMGPTTSHETEIGTGDVQLDDLGQPVDMAAGKVFEEPHGAKTEPPRDRQAKVLRSYPVVFCC